MQDWEAVVQTRFDRYDYDELGILMHYSMDDLHQLTLNVVIRLQINKIPNEVFAQSVMCVSSSHSCACV